MPKVSVNILTKNRSELLKRALASVQRQTLADFEVVVVDDGSTDGTHEVLSRVAGSAFGGKDFQPGADPSLAEKFKNLKIISHQQSLGITASRQEALVGSAGEFVAVLDDDDEWVDQDKLKKQVEFLDQNPDYVLVGGGIKISNFKFQISKYRPQSDREIRRTMFLRNNFFTSAVMFRRDVALKAGGFIKDEIDLAEDYDLWLRLGLIGKMANIPEVFTAYAAPSYNKDKFKLFLKKQLNLISRHKSEYPWYWFAAWILKIRILFGS